MKRLQIVFYLLWIGLLTVSAQAQAPLSSQQEVKKAAHTFTKSLFKIPLSQQEMDKQLILAVRYGHEGIARALINEGADPNTSDAEGMYPIHYAVRDGHYGLVELLIRAGAYINVFDSNGNFPIHIAFMTNEVNYERRSIVDALLDVAGVELAGVSGIELNVPNADGFYPIHLAAASPVGRHKLEDLLYIGADYVDIFMSTPPPSSFGPREQVLTPLDLFVYYQEGGQLSLSELREMPRRRGEGFDFYDFKDIVCRVYNEDIFYWFNNHSSIRRLLQAVNVPRIDCVER